MPTITRFNHDGKGVEELYQATKQEIDEVIDKIQAYLNNAEPLTLNAYEKELAVIAAVHGGNGLVIDYITKTSSPSQEIAETLYNDSHKVRSKFVEMFLNKGEEHIDQHLPALIYITTASMHYYKVENGKEE